MPTVIYFDPAGSAASLIYGTDVGVSNTRDASIAFDGIYFGLGGSDTIYDTDGNGWIWASTVSSADVLFYGQGGNDVLVSFGGNDTLYGGTGNDILIANAGNDTVYGEDGNDQCWGGAGADQLNGGAGADWVIGGGGGTAANRDVLWGGDHDTARDIILGTVGSADRFVTSGNSRNAGLSSPSVDIAWYFTLGEDVIQLRGPGNGSDSSDQTSSLQAAYVNDFQGTGLAGTVLIRPDFIFLPTADIVMFLAGVNVTAAQLAGSIELG